MSAATSTFYSLWLLLVVVRRESSAFAGTEKKDGSRSQLDVDVEEEEEEEGEGEGKEGEESIWGDCVVRC